MDYSFNYGFLKEYMETFGLKKKDILAALGTQDFTSLNKWLNGERPIHVNAMLRFCNFYNVPLCRFFFDGDGMPSTFAPPRPEPGDITAPSGDACAEDRIAEIHVTARNLISPEQKAAVACGLRARDEQLRQRDAAIDRVYRTTEDDGAAKGDSFHEPFVMSVTHAGEYSEEAFLRMKVSLLEEQRESELKQRALVDELHARFDAERGRLLAIIEALQKEVLRLSAK